MQPYVGQIVCYRLRPGQVHAGQIELAAIVTKVHRLMEGEELVRVDLRIWKPDMVDPLIQQKVMALSDTVSGHCWRPSDAPAASGNAAALQAELAKAQSDIAELSRQVIELADLLTEPQAGPDQQAAEH